MSPMCRYWALDEWSALAGCMYQQTATCFAALDRRIKPDISTRLKSSPTVWALITRRSTNFELVELHSTRFRRSNRLKCIPISKCVRPCSLANEFCRKFAKFTARKLHLQTDRPIMRLIACDLLNSNRSEVAGCVRAVLHAEQPPGVHLSWSSWRLESSKVN